MFLLYHTGTHLSRIFEHLFGFDSDFINKKAKEILICFTNGKSHFPENKSVDVKSVKIKYKNGKEFTTASTSIPEAIPVILIGIS